jgi:hypothetical protein
VLKSSIKRTLSSNSSNHAQLNSIEEKAPNLIKVADNNQKIVADLNAKFVSHEK